MYRIKMTALLLALMLTFAALAGCAKKDEGTEPEASPAETAGAAAPTDAGTAEESLPPDASDAPQTAEIVTWPADGRMALETMSADFVIDAEGIPSPIELTADLSLPLNWTIRQENGPDAFPFLGGNFCFDIKYIYNADCVCVGAIGANFCTEEMIGDASLFDDHNAVYCMINNGSGFCVDTHDVYDEVVSAGGTNAVSEVKYSAAFLSAFDLPAEDVEHPAVLSMNTETHYYVVLEFLPEALYPNALNSIAANVTVK